jgi:hypothetical protein
MSRSLRWTALLIVTGVALSMPVRVSLTPIAPSVAVATRGGERSNALPTSRLSAVLGKVKSSCPIIRVTTNDAAAQPPIHPPGPDDGSCQIDNTSYCACSVNMLFSCQGMDGRNCECRGSPAPRSGRRKVTAERL